MLNKLFPIAAIIPVTLSLKCDMYADKNLPCVEVPRCSSNTFGTLEINQLSNGLGASVSNSEISLCFDDLNLYVSHMALKQSYLTNPGYDTCNDHIYNSNVAEMFIAPNMESVPHCYNELDISPFNVMFDSGIYNPNLNHSGIVGYQFPCEGTGIEYETEVNMASNYWKAKMSFSFELLNCPYECPLSRYCGHSTPNDVYRVNFFRINQLVETATCNSSLCEYMAWSPTMANPPAFHEPSKFGYMLLQF
jgi:hypothetical protein